MLEVVETPLRCFFLQEHKQKNVVFQHDEPHVLILVFPTKCSPIRIHLFYLLTYEISINKNFIFSGIIFLILLVANNKSLHKQKENLFSFIFTLYCYLNFWLPSQLLLWFLGSPSPSTYWLWTHHAFYCSRPHFCSRRLQAWNEELHHCRQTEFRCTQVSLFQDELVQHLYLRKRNSELVLVLHRVNDDRNRNLVLLLPE